MIREEWVRRFFSFIKLKSFIKFQIFTGDFVSEIIAYLLIIFFIIIPLLLKVMTCMKNYNINREIDLESGVSLRSSQITLRVPENGGVE